MSVVHSPERWKFVVILEGEFVVSAKAGPRDAKHGRISAQ